VVEAQFDDGVLGRLVDVAREGVAEGGGLLTSATGASFLHFFLRVGVNRRGAVLHFV